MLTKRCRWTLRGVRGLLLAWKRAPRSLRRRFEGTLIRLPFRRGRAGIGHIKEMSDEAIKRLLSPLSEELLLFLANVQEIEVREWGAGVLSSGILSKEESLSLIHI